MIARFNTRAMFEQFGDALYKSRAYELDVAVPKKIYILTHVDALAREKWTKIKCCTQEDLHSISIAEGDIRRARDLCSGGGNAGFVDDAVLLQVCSETRNGWTTDRVRISIAPAEREHITTPWCSSCASAGGGWLSWRILEKTSWFGTGCKSVR